MSTAIHTLTATIMSPSKCFALFWGRRRRSKKTPEEEDRLSALPDPLLHHILSLLPSTKDAIRTSVLSKRWRHQWTNVSSLVFDFSGMPSACSIESILDRTLSLHDCPKVQKFQITLDRFYKFTDDPNFEGKIRFVVGKQVEELVLKFPDYLKLRFMESFYCQPSLLRLQVSGCYIQPMGTVNWGSLKELSIEDCSCSCEEIKSIVSGSPLLQTLQLKNHCYCRRGRFVIASKSLKRLVVHGSGCGVVGIWCPNLVEFYGSRIDMGWFDKVLEKFLSGSPLLEVLELQSFWFQNLRIASTTLKRIVFGVALENEMQISCPHLKELVLAAFVRKMTLTNLPSSVCVSLNYVRDKPRDGTLAKQILEQLQHLNELKLGSLFIESLSALEKDGISHPLLNCKSLTLEDTIAGRRDFDIPGIAYALRSLPLLERLVIKVQPHKVQSFARPLDFGHLDENYWNSHETHFSNLVSRLRTVEITGLSKAVLYFVEFLLKNASALEKLVVMLEDDGTDFVDEVSQKLLSFPRCSNVSIKVLRSK